MTGPRCAIYYVIWSLLWVLGPALAAPNPVEQAAENVFNANDGQVAGLGDIALDNPPENGQQLMQDMVAAYAAFVPGALGGGCTEEKMIVRREWSDLSPDDRRAYIAACKCLHDAPAKTPTDLAPGVRNRWDDFVAAHLFSTYDAHRSPWLLPYHRAWVAELERALRDECGLQIGQPYWDPSRYNNGQPPETWPIFDGSDTSLSGNGKADTPNPGCSCIQDGPLKDWKVHLGPAAGNQACSPNPQADGLGFNERCLERQFKPDLLANLTYDNVTFTIGNFKDIDGFALYIESWPTGIHNIPHAFIGGTNADVPGSPGDPMFPCHHARVDMLWNVWVAQDPAGRSGRLAKAETFAKLRSDFGLDPPKSIGPDDVIKLSPIFDDIKVADVLSTTAGRYCYKYV